MKKNLLFCLAAIFFLAQSCTKNNVKSTVATPGKYSLNKDAGPEGKSLDVGPNSTFATYELMSASSGQCAEIAGLSLANGGTGDLTAYTGIAHQQWRVINVGVGYFKIMNLGSGKYLQASQVNGTYNIEQNSDDAGDDQVWQISSTGQDSYYAINKACGLSPTVPPNGSSATLTAYTGSITQMWTYQKLPNYAYRDDSVVNFFHRTSGSVAFDQGNSIPISDGRSLWVTEDTYTSALLNSAGLFNCNQIFNIHNSILIQQSTHSWTQSQTVNMTNTLSQYQYEVIPSPGGHNSTYSWPGVGAEANGHVYMYCYESANGSTPATTVLYDFTETLGSVWPNPVRTTPAGMADSITYTEGMVNPGDGYIYVYGNVGVFLDKYVYVARFPTTNSQTWTFWNGSSWQSTPTTTNAAKITVGTGNAEQANTTIAYVNGKYVMMQMDIGYFCNPSQHNIYLSTATSPTGPFTAPLKVFTIEDMINGSIAKYYTPAIHPEFNNSNNELLLTYCLNYNGSGSPCTTNVCTDNGYMDPNYYQVKAVRVPYSLIGL
jgi:hypothetical protein